MPLTRVTKVVEFDAGHRIPSHASKCRNLHGHRYRLEVTLEGPVNEVRGESDDGMVLDFGDIKKIMNEVVHDPWDHSFLVYKGDLSCRAALEFIEKVQPNHQTVVLDVVPTAENLAGLIFARLQPRFATQFGGKLNLANVRLFETPNSWADCSA